MDRKPPKVIDIPPQSPPPTDLHSNFASQEVCEAMVRAWEKEQRFRCKKCGGPAYKERGGESRWGCPTDQFTTRTPTLHFDDTMVKQEG